MSQGLTWVILLRACDGHWHWSRRSLQFLKFFVTNYYVTIDPLSSSSTYMSYPVPLKVGVRGVTDVALIKWQVKLQVNVKITLEQATKAHRGSTSIALLFL